MSISNSKDLLIKATVGKYAVGAFNVTSIIQMVAIIEAAEEVNSPVIIQTSVSPAKQLTPELFGVAFRFLAQNSSVPVALQLDHCSDIDFCKRCVDAGYTSIMIDASKETLKNNIQMTKTVVDYTRTKGNASIEGELGTVGGVEDQIRVVESDVELCDPLMAVKFVNETSLDNLAPAIGTAHGIYKTRNPKIDILRLKNISESVNGLSIVAPLVVHGGTGLSELVVKELIAVGGSKFNVSTELKYAWIDAANEYIKTYGSKYNPVKMNQLQMDAAKKVVFYWIKLLGSAKKG
ncbi:MAG: class II fructose-bisphosphate aldolase family protein [Spirochaetia bacterium]|jgi:tagatose 1,6-diphosphate aldolase GatY/KbaY|nr:class II fructose-bisphosphate aldolase family protein [Spirochaetia bacterium]